MNNKNYRNRVLAAAMAGLMGAAAAFSPAASIESLAAWDRVNGYYQMIDGSAIEGVVARGIDVSHWKQDIDWNAVASDDVQFVMLGTRYSGDVDPYFRENATKAADAGLKVGAYIYSYATTTQMAEEEADFVLNLVKDYPISFPIAFDVEASVQSTLSPGNLSAIINAFCKKVEAAGYYPIVYANDYWLANKIDMSQVKYDVWVARYEVKHTFDSPAMWQATSTGSVKGVSGNVDIDFLYKDFSSHIPSSLWRTINGQTHYYQDYVMQKNSWINDGANWYYMDQDGLAFKGWMEQSGEKYYLDEADGRMATGWKQFGDASHYFNGNGTMAKGWIEESGKRYFLNQDGQMQTGWMTDNGQKYLLKDDGSASVGWVQSDGSWYYFNPTADMATGWISPDGSWYFLNSDGQMQTGWITDKGSSYYLNPGSGKMAAGWAQIDGSWYYFNGGGAMVTGLMEIDGQTYYLNPEDGRMAVSTSVNLDGTEYQIDENGICRKAEAEAQGSEAPAAEAGEAPASSGSPAPSGSPTSESESAPAQTGPGV